MEDDIEYDLDAGHEHDYDEEESASMSAGNSNLPYEILSVNEIYKRMITAVTNISQMTNLSESWSLLLFREFNWDLVLFQQLYFLRQEHYLDKLGYSNFKLQPELTKSIGSCDVCASDNINLISNICGHTFCLLCWSSYISDKCKRESPFLVCMEEGCTTPVLHETVLNILGHCENSDQLLLLYTKKLSEHFCSTNESYRFCIGAGCLNVIKKNSEKLEIVHCNCGKTFCFNCHNEDHFPCNCDQREKWITEAITDDVNEKFIKQDSKPCPKCKYSITRNGGCNQMTCKCTFQFCYMCGKPWFPDHNDHYNCHIYVPKSKEEQDMEQEDLEKLVHCTDNYLLNQSKSKFYKELDSTQDRNQIYKLIGVRYEDTEFIEVVYNYARECCDRVKWIYAYMYLAVIDNKQEEHFDFIVGNYEFYKENMLKNLAVDLKNFLNKLGNAEEEQLLTPNHVEKLKGKFFELKKKIIDYSTGTKKYQLAFEEDMKKLFKELERMQEEEELNLYFQKINRIQKTLSSAGHKSRSK